MADTFKVKFRYHAYKCALFGILYPAYVFDRISKFLQDRAHEIRPAAVEALFATEAGAELKIKMEEATKNFLAKLKAHLDSQDKANKLPEVGK